MKTSDELWSKWFDNQDDICTCIENAVDDLSEENDDMFRVALWAAVIELGSEKIRNYIPLRDKEPVEDSITVGITEYLTSEANK